MTKIRRSTFLKRAGLFSLGVFTLPSFARAGDADIFALPGDKGHVRHGLLTEKERLAELPSWIHHMQRDRFYANGHNESDNDLITYSIKTGNETICVARQKEEYTLLLKDETINIEPGLIHETKDHFFRFVKLDKTSELEWDPNAVDPVLVVLQGGLWHGITPINEGEGLANLSRNKIKLRPVESTMVCLCYRKKFLS